MSPLKSRVHLLGGGLSLSSFSSSDVLKHSRAKPSLVPALPMESSWCLSRGTEEPTEACDL